MEADGGVLVAVNGMPVGYLPANEAKPYWAELFRLHAIGYMPVVSVELNVTHSLHGEWLDLYASVQLAAPHHLVPVNRERLSGIAVLSWGRRYKVTGATDQFSFLSQYGGETGDALVVASLHPVSGEGRRKDYLAVHVDGTPVGRLSPVASDNLKPAVDYAGNKGLVLGTWAVITASGIASEMSIRARPASELSPDWLASPTLVPDVPILHEADVERLQLPNPTPPPPAPQQAPHQRRRAQPSSPQSSADGQQKRTRSKLPPSPKVEDTAKGFRATKGVPSGSPNRGCGGCFVGIVAFVLLAILLIVL